MLKQLTLNHQSHIGHYHYAINAGVVLLLLLLLINTHCIYCYIVLNVMDTPGPRDPEPSTGSWWYMQALPTFPGEHAVASVRSKECCSLAEPS